MGYKTPPCTNRSCEHFGSDKYVKIWEQATTWSFFCEACRKSLRVLTKEGFRKKPGSQGTPDDDIEKAQKVRL